MKIKCLLLILPLFIACIVSAEENVIMYAQIPFGADADNSIVVENSTIVGIFTLESFLDEKIPITLDIHIPKPLKASESTSEIIENSNESILRSRFDLITEYDSNTKYITLVIPNTTGEYVIKGIAYIKEKNSTYNISKTIKLRVLSRDEIEKLIEIEGIDIPAYRNGEVNEKFERNSFVIQESKDKVTTWVAIRLKNNANNSVNIVVGIEFLNPRTRTPVKGFEPPEGHEELTRRLISINKTKTVTIPIFTEDDITLPGEYLMRTYVKLFGSDATIAINYTRVNAILKSFMKLPMLVSLITILLGVILFIIFYFKHKSLFRRYSTTELVIISLFGSTKFVTVAIPGTIIWRIAEILGPFSIFITGIFYDILKPMLTIAVVGLIPRPGTATLSILIFWLMDGIVFGSIFRPITILWYISVIFSTEIILYLLGITSGNLKIEENNIKLFPLVGFSAAISKVYGAFTFWYIYMFFYRLFYANWYIALSLIQNFVYAFIGGILGIKLAFKLRKVRE